MMFMLTQNSRNTTAIDNGDFILSFRFYHYFCKAQRADAVRDFDARGKPRMMQPAVAPSAVDMVREAENNFAKESFHLTYQSRVRHERKAPCFRMASFAPELDNEVSHRERRC